MRPLCRLLPVIVTLLAARTAAASELYCDERYASPASYEETEFTVVNDTDTTLDLYWWDFSGYPQLYTSIPPGGSHTQPTYVGHIWRLMSEDGECVSAFKAERGEEEHYFGPGD